MGASFNLTTVKESVPNDLWEVLSSRLTEKRRDKMLQVCDRRSAKLRLILQDVENPHNISACMRSADAFGISTVHVVSAEGKFSASTVAKGVAQWLDIHVHPTIAECAQAVKADGYKIAAAMPHERSVTLNDLQVDVPMALLFGNEQKGVSESWGDLVDTYYAIPMSGMVESLNVSVCAAISLWHLTHNAKHHFGASYYLSSAEKQQMLNQWMVRQVPTWRGEYARSTSSAEGGW